MDSEHIHSTHYTRIHYPIVYGALLSDGESIIEWHRSKCIMYYYFRFLDHDMGDEQWHSSRSLAHYPFVCLLFILT